MDGIKKLHDDIGGSGDIANIAIIATAKNHLAFLRHACRKIPHGISDKSLVILNHS